VNIRFDCPECQRPARLELPAITWQCPGCDHVLEMSSAPAGDLQACAVCGNRELYKKKDFPHWLGLTILTVACLSFFALNLLYHQWLAWTILIASAVLDGGLYLWVGDAVVCYRCGANYRGFPGSATHKPFELGVGERYRQERLRRAQLQAEKKS
jgi:hypothetical protein